MKSSLLLLCAMSAGLALAGVSSIAPGRLAMSRAAFAQDDNNEYQEEQARQRHEDAEQQERYQQGQEEQQREDARQQGEYQREQEEQRHQEEMDRLNSQREEQQN